jgi:hypothetical protein
MFNEWKCDVTIRRRSTFDESTTFVEQVYGNFSLSSKLQSSNRQIKFELNLNLQGSKDFFELKVRKQIQTLS